MRTFGADAAVPDPSPRVGLTLQKSLGRLPLAFVDGIVARLNIDGNELVRRLLPGTIRSLRSQHRTGSALAR
jgi:hypothetical protein